MQGNISQVNLGLDVPYILQDTSNHYYVVLTNGEMTQMVNGNLPYGFTGGWFLRGFSIITSNYGASQPISCARVIDMVSRREHLFKNGKSKILIKDTDHGTPREWGSRLQSMYPADAHLISVIKGMTGGRY